MLSLPSIGLLLEMSSVPMEEGDLDVISSGIDGFIEDIYRNSVCNEDIPRRSKTRMSIAVPTKGLVNAPGENNCYLNTSVQLLWHMDVFRRSFRLLEGHACLESACIFCALKNIFQQFQDSNATVLAADDLRKAMANAFMDDHRFQLGRMDDAAECFENILHRLHNHIANAEPEDTCSAKHCVPHQKFGQHILEQTSCQCQATSEPKAFYQFVHYVSASSLVELVQKNSSENYPYTFGECLKTIMLCGERRPCPDERRCLYKGKQPVTKIQTTLMNCPDVVTVGVSWDSDHPNVKFISSFMDSIGEDLFLVDLFDNIPDNAQRRIGLNLSGVVAYYGKHYTSFFYNSRDKLWYYFDDENVQQLGSQWANVKTKIIRSKLQPLLLTYTNATGEPVNIEDASSSVVFVSKDKLLHQPPKDAVGSKPRRHSKKRGRVHGSTGTRSKITSEDALQKCNSDSITSSRSDTGESLPINNIGRFGHSTLANSNEISRNSNEKVPISLEHISMYDESTNEAKDSEYRTPNDDNTLTTTAGITYNNSPPTTSSISLNAGTAITNATSKTSDFFKKTFNNITKNKYLVHKNSSSKAPQEQCLDPVAEVSFADVGFDSPASKEISKSLPIKDDCSFIDESNKHQKQLQNLERHQEALSTPKTTGSKSAPVPAELDITLHTSRNAEIGNMHTLHAVSTTEAVQSIPGDDGYYTEGEFESLVSKGEYYINECEKCEKEGEVSSALQMCVRAKSAFYTACHIPGINESVIQFADLKYMQCVQKEKMLEQQPNLALLQQKAHQVLSGGDREVNKSKLDNEHDSHLSTYSRSMPHPSPDKSKLENEHDPDLTNYSRSKQHPSPDVNRSKLENELDLHLTAYSRSKQHPSPDVNRSKLENEHDSHLTNYSRSTQHPLPAVDVSTSTQIGINDQSALVRTECQTTMHGIESSDSCQQSDCGQTKLQRSNTGPGKVAAPKSPNTNKTNKDRISIDYDVNRSSSFRTGLPERKIVPPTEKLRQSSLLYPKLYDPDAYTSNINKEKRQLPRTIYDSNVTLHPKTLLEKEENNETSTRILSCNDRAETVEKLISESMERIKDKPIRCAHCGWKRVENDSQLCFSCQSYA